MAYGRHNRIAIQSPGHKPRGDYVGVRLGIELRARAIHAADALGIPLSEWLRMAIASALDYGINGVNSQADPQGTGFVHGRALGLALAQQQIQQMMMAVADTIPMTIEEARERGMLPPGGAINGVY